MNNIANKNRDFCILGGTNGDTEYMRIQSNSGNVGIGTTNPQRTLDLSSTGQITFGNNAFGTNTSKQGIYWHSNDNYGIYRTSGDWTENTYQQLMIKFYTGIILDPGSGANSKSHVGVVGGMSIGDNYYSTKYDNGLIVQGNVGIGVTNPVSNFQIGNGTSAVTKSNVAQICGESSAANNELIALSLVNSKVDGSSTENGIATSLAFHLSNSWSPTGKISTIKTDSGAKSSMTFHTYNSTLTERMRIRHDGNVGIGTNDPQSQLHLKGTGDVQLKIDADSDNNGENDNPSILLTQDGEAVQLKMGIIGDAGQIITNSLANYSYL